MSEYVAIFQPGAAITSQASADITAGQVLVVSGVGTVGPSGANAANVVGIATCDAKSGAKVVYQTSGVHELVNSGGVTAGDIIVSAASGQVAKLAAVTTPTAADVTNTRAIIGVALTTATTGNKCQVQVRL